MPIEYWLLGFYKGISGELCLKDTLHKKDNAKNTSYNVFNYKYSLAKTIADDISWRDSDKQNHLISYQDENYPPLLKQINKAPPLLFVRGDPALLSFPLFGIVGSRKPTREGINNSRSFSSILAEHGISIVSGLAYGIDAAAHVSSLNRPGKTIAVIGTGIDIVYPRIHYSLVESIVENGGAIISIFPRNTSPLKHNFPQRNRIISGMSLGLLVVEAGLMSGAMITARLAAEQGREVFAIPGSIHSPLAKGTNKLIKNGANLVEDYKDIIKYLEPVYKAYKMAINKQLTMTETVKEMIDKPKINNTSLGKLTDEQDSPPLEALSIKIMEELDKGGLDIDRLVIHTKEPVNVIDAILVELEIKGLIFKENGLYHKNTG